MSADLPRIKKEIDSCIAAFFGCDASMDETEKDHEYILLNMIEKDGKRDLKFIGIGHVTAPVQLVIWKHLNQVQATLLALTKSST